MKLYYRLCHTTDPEERLEDAALWKALHDEFGDDIALVPYEDPAPQDGYLLGRGKNMEWAVNPPKLPIPDYLPYWTDPAFLKHCGRSFAICDWYGANQEVERLHAANLDAFVKSTKTKHLTQKVPQGLSLSESLEDMAFSFIDVPNCLMVQECIDMAFERRFIAINRQVVTFSPIAVHLTPLDHTVSYAHFLTPLEKRPWIQSRELAEDMYAVAQSIAEEMATPHAVIDLAVSNDQIVVVEFNSARIGQFGLYACNPREIAKAVRGVVGDIDKPSPPPKSDWDLDACITQTQMLLADRGFV